MWWYRFFNKRNPEKDLNVLVESLKTLIANDLKSVILFGSYGGDEFHSQHSDVNVMVVAGMAPDVLKKMEPALERWLRRGHAAPVLVAPHELPGFARAFPIEFLDMQDRHRVLQGDDPLASLSVDRQHLRAQCEHDLALIQLRLRQSSASGDARALRAVLFKSQTSLLTLLNAMARLEGMGPQRDRIKAAEQLAERFHWDIAVLKRLQELKHKDVRADLNDLTTQSLKLLESVLQLLHMR